jgi:hypothetical protein
MILSLQRKETCAVPYKLMLEFAEISASSSLNMWDYAQSKATVKQWRNKLWICTGSLSQYLKYKEVYLHEVVPWSMYKNHKPGQGNHKSGETYYDGGKFYFRREPYAILPHVVELIETDEEEQQESQLSFI